MSHALKLNRETLLVLNETEIQGGAGTFNTVTFLLSRGLTNCCPHTVVHCEQEGTLAITCQTSIAYTRPVTTLQG